ncbi:endopeptidase La [Candidatus Shapirobacteria bacterium CG08_land_8_20_14_0_20_39_18]|uniref:Lon protease n=1 Tax=Candidatus Shapirobacteria bacterium CG08_land_8_20_14_0_20_39_18 TaxID=1974883 RepID=A0A2M6XE08_9BACT|nr:MAG: endopeptidase La [Candidatus Shapirobacteria bacterium CG08_land_8_20_14_0_20_39_18]PIY64614.1 MAG: endopeptidase La [Candidatus Shapirobacteria bacterium CG_4_10_14_0_8_um_filter_39_15]
MAEKIIPAVAVRDTVIFPHVETLLTFGRPKSNSALKAAFSGSADHSLAVFAQRDGRIEDPKPEDLYNIGVLVSLQNIFESEGNITAGAKGVARVKIKEVIQTDPYFLLKVEEVPDILEENDETNALGVHLVNQFKQAFNLGKNIDPLILIKLSAGVSLAELADQIASSLDIRTPEKQKILEMIMVKDRLLKAAEYLGHEMKILDLERSISNKTQARFEKEMKQTILRERKKTIEKELGEEGEDEMAKEFRIKIKEAGMPVEARKKAEKELFRFAQMSPMNPERSYIENWLDWVVSMPWTKSSPNHMSISKAAGILDEDHYGLKKIKERVVEYLAVMKLRANQANQKDEGKIKEGIGGPTILSFIGPPGVGKTSIGKSIARALGRKFFRVSLGGIRDEAEIRGHRRTYVGAMPGRIIQGIKDAGTRNPVFMLDEIDKIGIDFRGDPSAALLEALDPEQNKAFSDHYLEIPYDLSGVMFICTGNILDTIPPALRDRLEIIFFPGYTEEEKFHIAQNFLWPKQTKANGLPEGIKMTNEVLYEVVRRYTREAGVRELERMLAMVCRKIARQIAEKKKINKTVDLKDLKKYLGVPRYSSTIAEKKDEIGMSTGLAWTEAGGEILFIEVALMPGKGQLILTGSLGEVMKESCQAALSYVRSHWKTLGLKENFAKALDVHIHVPEGAVPKDGPSAGVAIATALVSALTKNPVKRNVGMTGEITLRGRVLEIGGVKEKVIAAHRAGLRTIILPKDNHKDLEEIPTDVKKDIKFYFASEIGDVLRIALKTESTKSKPEKVIKENITISSYLPISN